MNRTTGRAHKLLITAGAAGILALSLMAPSRSDGPMVPAPKLPPPPAAAIMSDGSVVYPDGTVLYASGVYVAPDGTTGTM
ncbi:MAG TPA: hypothetical protein VLH79_13395 [Chthonomonadales bacterium]|nr:hypothetical protein [Chthonomonadales bacterium]